MVNTANLILSFFTVIAQIAIVFLIIAKITKNKEILNLVSKKNTEFSFLVVLGGIIGSLFYSQVVGYQPCDLCWWQRIFLYPQIIILGIALFKKENIASYIKTLSIVGLVISGYHSLLQMGLVPSVICGATSVSCVQRYFINFGYITLPLMGFTAFLLLTILNWKNKDN